MTSTNKINKNNNKNIKTYYEIAGVNRKINLYFLSIFNVLFI